MNVAIERLSGLQQHTVSRQNPWTSYALCKRAAALPSD